jgi:thioredoxin-like negative regulator of GroEL
MSSRLLGSPPSVLLTMARAAAAAGIAAGLAISGASCKRDAAPGGSGGGSSAASGPGAAGSAAAAVRPDPCATARPHGPLAWIHDDYPAALACARARRAPLVLDLWAPWCHTCLSMQSTVLTDPALAELAPRLVFAALDTDRDVNAGAVARYPLSAWPTFYVVSTEETVLARFVGAGSVQQIQQFLEAGLRAAAGGVAGADAHLLAAERAIASKDLAAAERELRAAIADAPETWPRRPEALLSLIATVRKRGDVDGCLTVAERWLGATGTAANASDFLVHAMACATTALGDSEAPASAGAAAPTARVHALRGAAAARWRQLVEDRAAPLSVDDRSDAMANLREVLIALDRGAEARAVAEQQRAMLDQAAAAAPTPKAAMTFNWPRAEVYVFLDRPLELVPALERSIRELPSEYDPPARLGWIYWKAGKLAEAARWTDVASGLAYGPRKARVLNQRAEIAAQAGDRPAERAARAALVKTLEALPAGQTTPEAIERARAALSGVATEASPPAAGSAAR